ncbi:SorB family sulfite dehydrogenase c-type cytochrome subunit [Glaciimonas soli]|uniref:C-type cytochrome n=1 Tax=Glaciimonas soli TaxID=2590999 RepID=A0A843YQW7_9BURK|nr:c-type cytochrome [Glaciimonas soli]MQQ99887.1 c-type cytochrome [Glaciimonas soli]
MKSVKYMVFCLVIGMVGVVSTAQAATITLPQETAELKPSSLPGYAIAVSKCAICHSADYINQQPPKMNLTQWTAEAAKMQHAYGAPLSDDDVIKIGEYLAVTYGDAKPGATAAIPSPAAVPAKAAASKSIDVNALLAANACLACHSVDNKIVGPSFKDVAAKYHGDNAGQTKIAASIRDGSTGKWGAGGVMPPHPTLSSDDIKAMAEFVAKQ